ncbi:MAG TPA: glycosyltransferase family 4 protein [Solirubrobacteraceae bacterium]|jgi:glycosyltransferase involved in cell wall biosynthesis|nr:glycosyltransferase family 4 protein [Solirubrobacteraceae bacterium]
MRSAKRPGRYAGALAETSLHRLLRIGRRHRRRRLALVTPWPPQESGVAGYNRRLAAALSRHVDVDVVVAGPRSEFVKPDAPGVRLTEAAAWKPGRDGVLFCMGNSSVHDHVYELLREHPGAVVLHDAQLTGFFGMYAGRERPSDPLGRLVERVERVYGARIPSAELRSAPLDYRRRMELGIFLTAEVACHAERLFVHSAFAEHVAEEEVSLTTRAVPVGRLPFAMPAAAQTPRGAAATAPLIVHMGAVSEEKGVGGLIEGFGLLVREHPNARLVIAGPAEDAERERWSEHARACAPGADVALPGRVSESRYAELLASADLAVQLRDASNGEASAAVADCLAAGIPTLATRLGWSGELPATAVRHVEPQAAPHELATAISELLADTPARVELSAGALEHARRNSFEVVAEAYLSALGFD